MKMSAKFTCRFCKEQFDVPKGLYKHLQLAHNASVSRDNHTCPICGVLCSKYESYRDHLLYIHGQTEDGQKLTFKSLNEFLVWKAELELKHNCKYVLQTTPKVLPTKEKKYFYQCDRSNSKSKDRKSMSVVMKTCSSVISVVEGSGVFKVEYWDAHSGHNEVPSAQSVQSELEAAISSVEMVNAIGDSDDSFERSEELSMTGNSSPSNSNAEKKTFFVKTNSSNSLNNSSVANIFQKSKAMKSFGKVDIKKKTNNTSILFSLASVACGKGISKKSANKVNENNKADGQSSSKPGLNINSENVCEKSDSSAIKQVDDLESKKAVSEDKSEETTVTSTVTTSSPSLSVTTKTTPSGPPAIAPKITTVASNTISSLFPTNSNFSNQFVIVNPASMDQNSLTSSQNVFTSGQNILLSLGPVGQNAPSNTTPKSIKQSSVIDAKKYGSNIKFKKGGMSPKVSTANAFTSVKKSINNTQSVSNNIINTMTSTITSNSTITLTPGLNNTPVILSSLPVGSTFMSVNNNLIPIASPSGAFIPTSLPPNIVLAPVGTGASLANMDSSKTTVSSANSQASTPQNIQTQSRFTAPSTVAITVSSIVKEPLYTSATKHVSNIVSSSISPVSSTSTPKTSRQRTINKFIPITTAGRVSPVKRISKNIILPKESPNVNKSKTSPNSVANKAEINLSSTNKTNKVSTPVSSKSLSSVSSVTDTDAPTPTYKLSARKRITKSAKSKSPPVNPAKSSPVITTANDFSTFNTKVVNSRLHLTPISSTPNVTMSPQLNVQKPGTMLFESSAGDIYMLEPVENDGENLTSSKSISIAEAPKIKIDRSMQTIESSGLEELKSKFQRKRAAPLTDDSAVMLKVKCYQLEMNYISSQTECKRLKVELTKERMKNAQLSGKKTPINLEEDLNESSSSKAVEIMKEIEDKFSENKDVNIYTMTKTSVLRNLYEDVEELCVENDKLYRELENYRAHDKFYKSLKKRLYDEEF